MIQRYSMRKLSCLKCVLQSGNKPEMAAQEVEAARSAAQAITGGVNEDAKPGTSTSKQKSPGHEG